jgi:IS5 family transposase
MKQQDFAAGDFEHFRKSTRREQFLSEMDKVVPWQKLCQRIEPFYPKAGNGHPPVGLERMLRIDFLQHWFNLSDPGAEEALYESHSMCRFAGIDLGREPVPDESTILNFRHSLEQCALGEALFQAVGEHLQERGWALPAAPSWMPPLLAPRARPRTRTRTRRAIQRCVPRARASSGTLA